LRETVKKEETKMRDSKQKYDKLLNCKADPKAFLEAWGILSEESV
jgi:hypothetical protein